MRQLFFGLKLLLQGFGDLIDLLVGKRQLLLKASLQLGDIDVSLFQGVHGIFMPQDLPLSSPLAERGGQQCMGVLLQLLSENVLGVVHQSLILVHLVASHLLVLLVLVGPSQEDFQQHRPAALHAQVVQGFGAHLLLAGLLHLVLSRHLFQLHLAFSLQFSSLLLTLRELEPPSENQALHGRTRLAGKESAILLHRLFLLPQQSFHLLLQLPDLRIVLCSLRHMRLPAREGGVHHAPAFALQEAGHGVLHRVALPAGILRGGRVAAPHHEVLRDVQLVHAEPPPENQFGLRLSLRLQFLMLRHGAAHLLVELVSQSVGLFLPVLLLIRQDLLAVTLCLLALRERQPILESIHHGSLVLPQQRLAQRGMHRLSRALGRLALLAEAVPSREGGFHRALLIAQDPLVHRVQDSLVCTSFQQLGLGLVLIQLVSVPFALVFQVSFHLFPFHIQRCLGLALSGSHTGIVLPAAEDRLQNSFGIAPRPLAQGHVNRGQFLLILCAPQGPFGPDLVDLDLQSFGIAQDPLLHHQTHALVRSSDSQILLAQLVLVLKPHLRTLSVEEVLEALVLSSQAL
mmetsp:Transcript_57524/g.125897  ORF Transcript_57524/g.125897 Transcript_57524/m.125897 type:complete len:571 (-) Transcript_57524:76-1788(-)